MKPVWAALAGAVAISFSAIFFALADVSPITGGFFRFAYALPVLLALTLRAKGSDLRTRRSRLLAIGAGVILSGDVIAWHIAIDYIGAGLATLLANTQVVLVGIIAWIFLGERPSRVVLLAVPTVLAGVALVSGVGQSNAFGEEPARGALLAMCAALMYAGFLLAYRRSNQQRVHPARPLLEVCFGALIGVIVMAPVVGGLDLRPAWPAHAWLLALALAAQVVGWLGIGYALPRLPAVETSTVIMLQPVLTMVWGTVLLSERPSGLQITGGALVIAGVGVVAFVGNRRTHSIDRRA